jgi:hypothetical protein
MTDGFEVLLYTAGFWTLGWVLLFYTLACTLPRWSKNLPPSSKEHENDKYWIARDVIGIIHALLVSALCVPAAFEFLEAPDWVQFASSSHLANCRVDGADIELLPWNFAGQAVALSGLAFTTFTLADAIVSVAHGLATVDYIIHHIAFVTAGMIIRGHCMLPFNAAVLMGMEASTPFLNYFHLVRHRGDVFRIRVIVCGISFFVLFLLWRIGFNLYATAHLWIVHIKGFAIPAHVPQWQARFLMVAVTAGAGVQFFWLPSICKLFMSRLRDLLKAEVQEQPLLNDTAHAGS